MQSVVDCSFSAGPKQLVIGQTELPPEQAIVAPVVVVSWVDALQAKKKMGRLSS
jgi:hypothetical protein